MVYVVYVSLGMYVDVGVSCGCIERSNALVMLFWIAVEALQKDGSRLIQWDSPCGTVTGCLVCNGTLCER